MMTEKDLKALVQEKLDRKRFEHTLRVVATGIELAQRFGADISSVRTAAYLHDIAKNLPDAELEKILRQGNETAYLSHSPNVWHAPAGAILSKNLYNITNPDILAAIKNHTTGRPEMSLVEEIVFLADYIEPGRKQPGVEEIRQLAENSLQQAIGQTLANTVAYLQSLGNEDIHPDTLAANGYYHRFLEI